MADGSDRRDSHPVNVTDVSGGKAGSSSAIGIQYIYNVVVNYNQSDGRGCWSLHPLETELAITTRQSKIQYKKENLSYVPTCPGKKKPCGAVLSVGNAFCTQCGWEIDKTMFQTSGRLCKGTRKDGAACNANIQRGSRFCVKCRTEMEEENRIGTETEFFCPGEKNPCGARLSTEYDYCPQCGWEIIKDIFFSDDKCKALTKDGTLCQADLIKDAEFCRKCGSRYSGDSSSRKNCIKLSPDPPFFIPRNIRSQWKLASVVPGGYLVAIIMLSHQQKPLLGLFMTIYKSYKAILDQVSDGSLVFTFLHETEEAAQHMIDDKDNVQELIKRFLRELDAIVAHGNLELIVELQVDTETDVKKGTTRPDALIRDQTSQYSRHPKSDVTQHVSLRTEQRKPERSEKSPETELLQTQSEDETFQTTPESREHKLGDTPIEDSEGQVLEPGDGVWFEGDFPTSWGLYVGNQEVVRCDRRTRRVERERLDLKKWFCKLRVSRRKEGDVREFPAQVRLDRAVSRVGTEFREGDGPSDRDFICWCYTGLAYIEARKRGFVLDW